MRRTICPCPFRACRAPRRPAPQLGEVNEYVCEELLGLDAGQIMELMIFEGAGIEAGVSCSVRQVAPSPLEADSPLRRGRFERDGASRLQGEFRRVRRGSIGGERVGAG